MEPREPQPERPKSKWKASHYDHADQRDLIRVKAIEHEFPSEAMATRVLERTKNAIASINQELPDSIARLKELERKVKELTIAGFFRPMHEHFYLHEQRDSFTRAMRRHCINILQEHPGVYVLASVGAGGFFESFQLCAFTADKMILGEKLDWWVGPFVERPIIADDPAKPAPSHYL